MAARIRNTPMAILSASLIVVGLLLAPLALVASWARAELSDTDRFVSTFAPLAEVPAVQGYLSTEVAGAVNELLDLPSLTSQVFEGVSELGLPPRSAAALSLLEAPITQGLLGLIDDATERVVTSEAFAEVWSSALRVSHSQVTATLAGDSSARVELTGAGELRVQLGPIIEAVKDRLVEQGMPFAASIPAVDRSVLVAQSDSLPTVQLLYGLVLGAGLWLPWVALLLLVAGVLAAGLRRRSIIRSGIALGAVMLLLSVALTIARAALVGEASAAGIPADAAAAVFTQLTASMRLSSLIVAALALAAAAAAWFTGDGAVPMRIRHALHPGVAPGAHGSLG